MTQQFEFITCARCGFEFGVPASFLERRRSDGNSFYCPSSGGDEYGFNIHSMRFKKPEPAKTVVKEVIKEVPVEVVVEKEYQPKDFSEILNLHEHDFSKKNSGGLSCKVCGLYKAAYQELTGTI